MLYQELKKVFNNIYIPTKTFIYYCDKHNNCKNHKVITMDDWIYFSLVHKENPEVELKCCIDLDTIDDDSIDCEYLQNDRTWNTHTPQYCKIDGVDYTPVLNELQEIEVNEWGWISQALADVVGESYDEVFIREFDKATLYMSYDGDFEAETATKLPNGIIVKNNYPFKQ